MVIRTHLDFVLAGPYKRFHSLRGTLVGFGTVKVRYILLRNSIILMPNRFFSLVCSLRSHVGVNMMNVGGNVAVSCSINTQI